MKKFICILLTVLLFVPFIPLDINAEQLEQPDVELWNAVTPLKTTVTFLNVGAHPDDERSDFLAYLSRGLGVKTASLIANRGEGGQNEIGNELGNALGIIRTREMIEAAKITGVKAYHLSETTSDPIYDYGFEKTPEETLKKWGEQLTYERLIKFIRTYQPDIVMPSFRDVNSEHGHHRTMTILSERAFKDAADPSVFPEQLKEGLKPWQIKKFYLPAYSKEDATTSIEIGIYDPIYGMTYPQLGEQSRYMHKSQGMGRDIPAEPRQIYLELVHSSVDDKGKNDLFAGIPYNFKEWSELLPKTANDLKVRLTHLQQELDSIVAAYPDRHTVFNKSQKALKDVRNIQRKIQNSKLKENIKNDLLHKLKIKEEQLQVVSFVSSSIKVKATAASNILTKGQQTTVSVEIKNNGKEKINHLDVSLIVPDGWKVSSHSKHLTLFPGKTINKEFTVIVPENAEYYHAYKDPVIRTKIQFEENGTKTEQIQELEGTVAVLPDISLTLDPENIVVNTADIQDEIPVTVKAKNYYEGKLNASVSLKIPKGWTVSPRQANVTLDKKLDEKEVTFTLVPPRDIQDGKFDIEVIASVKGKLYNSTIQEISYDHIGTFYYQYPSNIYGVAFELLKPDDLKIGYIESGFDKVADYLINVGFNITKLTSEDLATGDLSQYDTIITGIRAYLSRDDLYKYNDRLLEYVKNGGHLVVQYHKPSDRWDPLKTAPYKLVIGDPSIRWRVTDENAKVTITQPDSPLFHYPNEIKDSDWNNWVQERGLYFPMEWDSRFETYVSMADPNENPFESGILIAKYGEGTYAYTSLVFYRQIQNQVPGGYRIFTNLISYGKSQK
jgi:LmbE family N-acetylglucosaminyl deacetylase